MTITAMTRHDHQSAAQPTWLLAFELGVNTAKLACTTGPAQRPRERRVPAREIAAVWEDIVRATPRFGVPEAARVVSGSEAGRDGVWLHRALVAKGGATVVVESSSREVKRHDRRAKTARLAVDQRLTMRLRHAAGKRQVWSVVHVPSVDDEDRRQLHREWLTATRDRPRVLNRIKGVRASQGLTMPRHGDCLQQLEPLRLWDGSPVPPGLRHRLVREGEPWAGRSHQMAQCEAAHHRADQVPEAHAGCGGGAPEPDTASRWLGTGASHACGSHQHPWRAQPTASSLEAHMVCPREDNSGRRQRRAGHPSGRYGMLVVGALCQYVRAPHRCAEGRLPMSLGAHGDLYKNEKNATKGLTRAAT